MITAVYLTFSLVLGALSQVQTDRCEGDAYEVTEGRCIVTLSATDHDTYDFAEFMCKGVLPGYDNATLPSILSKEENDFYEELGGLPNFPKEFWLGITCERGQWSWLDGRAFSYHNFDEDIDLLDCTAFIDQKLYFAADGRWTLAELEGIHGLVCEYNADVIVPTPTPQSCEGDGGNAIDGVCYHVIENEHNKLYNFRQAEIICEDFMWFLPSIQTIEQLNGIILKAERYTPPEEILLWIGISCRDGNPTWTDGSKYDDRDSLLPTTCTSDTSFLLSGNGSWIENDNDEEIASIIVCSRRYVPSTTTAAQPTSGSPPTASTAVTTSEPTVPDHTTTPAAQSTDGTSTPTTTPLTTATTKSTTSTSTTSSSTIDKPAESSSHDDPDDPTPQWVWILIGGSIICGVVLVIVIACIIAMAISRKRALKMIMMSDRRFGFKSSQSDLDTGRYTDLSSNPWEIDRKFIGIDYRQKLGEGAFGCVMLGKLLLKDFGVGTGRSLIELNALRSEHDEIAVKMLHESADEQAELEFRDEIDLMRKIGYHERLVNMIACVTSTSPILLITEYCANGDLLRFMRKRRVYNFASSTEIDETKIITARKQLMFAVQVAYGMEYLSSRGFVHRDLAARNILVDAQETCKIGDFGLCRAIGRESEHYHSHGGKLPLKWMAPEAIDRYDFPVASDVWSYGVLLFEIVTLGGAPYADWPAAELLDRLKNGDRMDRPDSCDVQLYTIMSKCWSASASDRPNFATLRKELGILLEEINDNDYYLKLDSKANYYTLESNAS